MQWKAGDPEPMQQTENRRQLSFQRRMATEERQYKLWAKQRYGDFEWSTGEGGVEYCNEKRERGLAGALVGHQPSKLAAMRWQRCRRGVYIESAS